MIASIQSAAKLKPTIVEPPAFDISAAISSGAINEQQLIAVLTQMCRCLLSAQQTHLTVAPELEVTDVTANASIVPLEMVTPAFAPPVAV